MEESLTNNDDQLIDDLFQNHQYIYIVVVANEIRIGSTAPRKEIEVNQSSILYLLSVSIPVDILLLIDYLRENLPFSKLISCISFYLYTLYSVHRSFI